MLLGDSNLGTLTWTYSLIIYNGPSQISFLPSFWLHYLWNLKFLFPW
jgi:hypothetical protein